MSYLQEFKKMSKSMLQAGCILSVLLASLTAAPAETEGTAVIQEMIDSAGTHIDALYRCMVTL